MIEQTSEKRPLSRSKTKRKDTVEKIIWDISPLPNGECHNRLEVRQGMVERPTSGNKGSKRTVKLLKKERRRQILYVLIWW